MLVPTGPAAGVDAQRYCRRTAGIAVPQHKFDLAAIIRRAKPSLAINAEFHPKVYELWRSEGCYPEIARRLGYRLRLVRASFPRSIRRGIRIAGSLSRPSSARMNGS